MFADGQDHRVFAVAQRRALDLFRAVFDARHVLHQERVRALLLDDQRAYFRGGFDATVHAQRELLRSGIDAAAGHGQVLRVDRALHVTRGDARRAEPKWVDPDVHLALATAEDLHAADAADRLQLATHALVRILRHFGDRTARLERNVHHRRLIRIELGDHGQVDVLRQIWNHRVQMIAHFLRGHVYVLLEQERDEHLRDAFGRDRAQLVDAADGVDRFFHLVGDFGLHVFRRCAIEARGHGDDRQVDLGEAIHPQLGVTEQADHAHQEDEHGRENRPFDADFS